MVRGGDLLVCPRCGASRVCWGGWKLLPVAVFVIVLLVVSAVPAGAAEPVFGIKNFKIEAIKETKEEATFRNNEEGTRFVNVPYSFSQAGGRPWAIATSAEFENVPIRPEEFVPVHDPKDIVATLPPGLIGNPQAVPRCPLAEATIAKCPLDTVVGWYQLDDAGIREKFVGPVVEVVPSVGESAEFVLENTTPLDEGVLTAHLTRVENPQTKKHEYAFTVVSKGVPQIGIFRFEVTIWGVPADESHSEMRGRFCKRPNTPAPLECFGAKEDRPAGIAPVAFWSYGSNCAGGPETATLRADSWQEPGTVQEGRYSKQYVEATTSIPAPTGCDKMSFGPLIEMLPETTGADEPVGTQVNVKVPQTEQPGSTATPDLRDATTTLPEGLSINPGVVAGVQACEENGPAGINFDGPESEEVGPSGELQLAPGHCPAASTVGTAEAITPLLNEPVKGHVYLARPLCGGAGQAKCTNQDALDGNLYQLYLELGGEGELANTGINIKARGFTQANPATGQLTTKFLDNPQTPFSELRIHLNGGPRAPLANPAACGPAVTTADFTPWSAPGITPEGLFVAGTPDATLSSYYTVSGCASPPGLAPGFSAGTVSPQAGQFSTFTMNLSRQDREQYIKGIQVRTPPGLLGMLSSVPLCPEAQANNPEVYGECTASKIGTTRVASGAGSAPFEIEGNVFLTGPYRGSPFGLSIVTHAVAGPFNLGLVVVRAQISVDPNNSTITVTADENGPYALPQILFGVPLRLQRISVNIDRPGFMFNPTNCEKQQVTAKVSGSQDATASVSTPFAAAGCRSLAFKPRFSVATSGHTSRSRGASLDTKLSYPPGSVGTEANIARVKVSLPRQLPSRLSTLQKACPAAVFDRNPVQCPAVSVVGVVRARTPLLPVGLSGPVYFVSHGGERFPDLVVVLQGDNVRVDLTGTTFISKAGITSTTFRTVPDVPVGTFELYLPEGKSSALGANTNLCNVKGGLKMPTEFVAQNGAVLKQSTKIAVSGCGKSRAKRARRARRARVAGTASQIHTDRRAGR
jgi:hypothetical protein